MKLLSASLCFAQPFSPRQTFITPIAILLDILLGNQRLLEIPLNRFTDRIDSINPL